MDVMDFSDSFTGLQDPPPAPLVKRHYELLNSFLARENDEFLDYWHSGPEAVLYFNYSERERTGEKVRQTFRQVREVLSRVPVGTRLQAAQIAYFECGELAYAVTMEKAISDFDHKTVVGEHRGTLVWRRFDGAWKLVHMHNDTYSRRDEAMSELLRGYHPDA